MPKTVTQHEDDEIVMIAERVGDVSERLSALEQERGAQTSTLDTARQVLEGAIAGLGALRSQVLENDIANLQLSLNDKARDLCRELQRFETALADVNRRAE